MWRFLPRDIELSMLAAIRAFGPNVVTADPDDHAPLDELGLGLRLVRLAFGAEQQGGDLPQVLAALIASPRSSDAKDEFVHRAFAAFNADPAKVAAADAMIVELYRRRADTGDYQAALDLAELLAPTDPQAAIVAYQRAIDTGNPQAMIHLAWFLERKVGDNEAALAVLRQAAGTQHAELAAEALCDIVFLHRRADDSAAADAALSELLEFGNPRWSGGALIRLGDELREDNPADAAALYRQAIEIGDPSRSAQAAVSLGQLLEAQGNVTEAKAVWLAVIEAEAADPDWAESAFLDLVNLLRSQEDHDGLRAAYQTGVTHSNPDALYALDQLGQLLAKHGDTVGAHAAWQQAIDAGYEQADALKEQMMPPAERRRKRRIDYPANLPDAFNPKNAKYTAIEVLETGLPALPSTLSYEMALPIAYWKAEQNAVVLILRFSRWRDGWSPMVMSATFTRDGDSWISPGHWHGGTWSHYPIAEPQSLRDLGGRPLVTGGGSTKSAHGRAAPTVAEIGVIQGDQERRRPLDSYFGAWVVCTDDLAPFTVTGYDRDGTQLASIGTRWPHR